MTNGSRPKVTVREVGPRDDLQATVAIMATERKLAWIAPLTSAGIREIDVARFVPPRLMPQMADAAAVTRAVRTNHAGLVVVALAPNCGARRTLMHLGVDNHSSGPGQRGAQPQQRAEDDGRTDWNCSTALGRSIQGRLDESDVVTLADELVEPGADVVTLADTVGLRDPKRVRRLVRQVSP